MKIKLCYLNTGDKSLKTNFTKPSIAAKLDSIITALNNNSPLLP